MSKSLKLIIEALLFASDKPLTYKDIQASLPDAKAADIKSALEVLQYEYDSMERSFALKEVAGGYQFRSHPEYGQYILRMLQTSPTRLSQASLETMAIIAYKQPVIRQEVEKLRGVDCGGILKVLLEKDLIKIMGRKDLPGRPLIYGTTKKFLEVFDLKDIDSLPKLREIKSFGSGTEEEPQGAQQEIAGIREEFTAGPDNAEAFAAFESGSIEPETQADDAQNEPEGMAPADGALPETATETVMEEPMTESASEVSQEEPVAESTPEVFMEEPGTEPMPETRPSESIESASEPDSLSLENTNDPLNSDDAEPQ